MEMLTATGERQIKSKCSHGLFAVNSGGKNQEIERFDENQGPVFHINRLTTDSICRYISYPFKIGTTHVHSLNYLWNEKEIYS